MSVNIESYQSIQADVNAKNVLLVAVSKTKPNEDIQALYALGHRDFGENYVQELVDKHSILPNDIHWHFIGHLQSNKVKYIAPFVYLIHGVDSLKLLQEINKQAAKCNRVIDCLLQVHIATEETKFGFDADELKAFMQQSVWETLPHIRIKGLMGMASNTDNTEQIRKEFKALHFLYSKLQEQIPTANTLSMGMSADYPIAIEEGSNLVRVGSLLFGARNYSN